MNEPKRRGRPPGSTNKPKDVPSASGTVPIDHNDNVLTDAQQQRLLVQGIRDYKDLLAAYKDASNDLKAFGKRIKADLGEHGMRQVKLAVELETPEGEAAFKARSAADLQAARWAGMEVGHMDDLFPENKEDRRAVATKLGRIAGLTGKDAKPPYGAGSEEGQLWMTAWHEGQAELAAGIGKKPPEPDFTDSDLPHPSSSYEETATATMADEDAGTSTIGEPEDVDVGHQVLDAPVDLSTRRRSRGGSRGGTAVATAQAPELVAHGVDEF